MKDRVSTREAFEKDYVTVAGWVQNFRNLNKIKFIILRDREGTLQVTLPKGKVPDEIFNIDLPEESVIKVKGKMVPSKVARGGKELIPDEIEVISIAQQPLPIDISGKIQTDLSKRLDWRSLDLRTKKEEAIFRIQSNICKFFREFFRSKGFVEIWTPEIIAAAAEGGTELFPVQYFEKKAYLAQSPQLYKQLLTLTNLERVFSITPIFRAEKHNTTKHLNESRQMDIEAAFMDDQEVIGLLTDAVKYIVKRIKEENKEELEVLNRDLKVPEVIKITYSEAVSTLKEKGVNIKDGEDLSSECEKKLAEIYGKDNLIVIHSWPTKLKPFYIMPREDNPSISRGFDVDYGGIELASGGQRIHIPELLTKRIKEQGLNPENFKFYIDAFKYGAPYHSGWSIGLERLTMIICGLDNIREACLFPRDRERLTP